jgi:hypothetical protein
MRSNKYVKYQHYQGEQRKLYLLVLVSCLMLFGIWHLFLTPSSSSSSIINTLPVVLLDEEDTQAGQSVLIQSLRRSRSRGRQHNHPHTGAALDDEQEREQEHGGIYMQQEVVGDQRSRDERLNGAIQELQKYQADAEGRKEELYQGEVKSQLEEELKQLG